MKTLSLITLALLISNFAQAAELASACYLKAEVAVEKNAEENYYDQDGFYAYECLLAPNNKAVVCEVSASKGDGAANDTFRVVLNSSCTKTYRVELIGEE